MKIAFHPDMPLTLQILVQILWTPIPSEWMYSRLQICVLHLGKILSLCGVYLWEVKYLFDVSINWWSAVFAGCQKSNMPSLNRWENRICMSTMLSLALLEDCVPSPVSVTLQTCTHVVSMWQQYKKSQQGQMWQCHKLASSIRKLLVKPHLVSLFYIVTLSLTLFFLAGLWPEFTLNL